jgi:hypothetical protein
MKKQWLYVFVIVGMLAILVIPSVTPVIAAGSSNIDNVGNRLNTTTIARLSASAIVLGGTVSEGAQLSYSVSGTSRPKPTGTFTFQVQQVSTKAGAAYSWVTYYTVNLNSSSNQYFSTPYSPMSVGNYNFRAVYSGDNYYMGSTSSNALLRVNAATSGTSMNLSSSSIKVGNSIIETVSVRGLGGLFPAPSGTVTFQVRYTILSPWVNYSSNVVLNSGKASMTFKPSTFGNWYFRAIYSGDSNYKGSQSAESRLAVTLR